MTSAFVAAFSGGGTSGGSQGDSGGSGDGDSEAPKGPYELGGPNVEWFLSGTIQRDRLRDYTHSSTHERGRHKANLWERVFGIRPGDEQRLERLIREQLRQAVPEARRPYMDADDPSVVVRRWRLDIPRFRGPNGEVRRVRTNWHLDERVSERPILTSPFIKETNAERRERLRREGESPGDRRD